MLAELPYESDGKAQAATVKGDFSMLLSQFSLI
jgi:hypothetical protein